MNKINLMDIMESLNSDDTDTASAALHEWFVDQARNVQARLSGEPVVEAEPVAPEATQTFTVIVRELKDNYSDEDEDDDSYEYFFENFVKDFQANSAEEAKAMAEAEIDQVPFGDDLVGSFGWENGSSGYSDDGEGEGLYVYHVEAKLGEARVDELSKDTMLAYSKAARKERDKPEVDDEKVGRRVAGLDMVAQKARRLKSQPQYEAEITESDDEHSFESVIDTAEGPQDVTVHFALDSNDISVLGVEVHATGEEISFEELSPETQARLSEKAHEEAIDARVMANDFNESEEEDDDSLEESIDDLIAELNEAFKGLETVSDKLQNQEGAQVGEQGKVPVNTKATLPSHKGKDRIGGEVVEIKSNGHTGHALEKAPKVADVKIKNTVQNGKEEPKKVTPKGDGSALLNKQDGKVNTQSPISGKGAKGLKN